MPPRRSPPIHSRRYLRSSPKSGIRSSLLGARSAMRSSWFSAGIHLLVVGQPAKPQRLLNGNGRVEEDVHGSGHERLDGAARVHRPVESRLQLADAERHRVTNELSVMVWLPLASIASTSKGCSPGLSDATNSGGSVTLVLVPG